MDPGPGDAPLGGDPSTGATDAESHPRRPRRGRLAVALVAMVAAGAVTALSLLGPTGTQTPHAAITASQTSASPAQLVTVTPAAPTASTTELTTGGSLTTPVSVKTSTGAGTIVISSATWTEAGQMSPPEGSAYLILRIRIEASSGRLDVSPLMFTAGSAGTGFGPALTDPLPGVVLKAGQQASGQVGFVLPTGEVHVKVLDETLQTVATATVPAP